MGAVCGNPTAYISVVDQLDGTCYYSYSDSNTYTVQMPCTESIFTYAGTGAPVKCGSLLGTLYVSYYPNQAGPCVGNTQGPQLRTHLTNLGLNDVTYIMTLSAAGAPQIPIAVRPPIQPYLSLLEGVQTLYLTESYDASDPAYSTASFPDLRALVTADTLSVSFTSVTNFASLSRLRCARIIGGYGGQLANFQGLEGLSLVTSTAPPGVWDVTPRVNFYAPSALDLSALSGLAQCLPGGMSRLEGTVAIVSLLTRGCRELMTWNAVCRYIQGFGCPPEPPSYAPQL
jgi:hypothetical protein